jgi:hypothetical protein
MRSSTTGRAIAAWTLLAAHVGCGGGSDGRGGSGGLDSGIGTLTGGGDPTAAGSSDAGSSGTEPGAQDDGVGKTKFDMGLQPDVSAGCGGGDNDAAGADFSYIWIANSAESTVSKINTETLIEEGRYITRPDSNGNPSRTSVNLNGDAVVANRSGGVTMIFARVADCGGQNTSTGPGDVKPWPDDCVGWHTAMNYASQRPVAWTRGEFDNSACRYDNVKVWTSGANASIDVVLLDGETGTIEQTVPIGGVAPDFYGIYGGAVDSRDNFWGTQLSGGQLVRVDRMNFAVQTWQTPAGGYGMAVDRNDRVWTCSAQVGRFDYPTQTWQTANAGGSGGCMPDGGDLLWLANAPMVAVDINTMAVVQTLAVPNYVHGVSIDFNGYVWGPAIYANEAYRVDPATGQVDVVTGLNLPYTYSDMTGFGLSQLGGPSG